MLVVPRHPLKQVRRVGCIPKLLFVVFSLLDPRVNRKLFVWRHLEDRPQSIAEVLYRSEDRSQIKRFYFLVVF